MRAVPGAGDAGAARGPGAGGAGNPDNPGADAGNPGDEGTSAGADAGNPGDAGTNAGNPGDEGTNAGPGPGAGDPETAGDPSEVTGWALVIPVKAPTRGKSRLDVPRVDRVSLARAIALDTIAAAAACDEVERVIVVTDDPQLPLHAFDVPGLRFVDESDAGGLNEAIALGVAAARRPAAHGASAAGTGRANTSDGSRGAGSDGAGDDDSVPDVERVPIRRCAALLADVPALRPADLSAALQAAASVERGVVADADGTGSTLVTAGRGVEWRSAFGDDSFARHVADGCTPLAVRADSTLRRDVDTAEHLADAARLGLGSRTARILASAPPT